jgi:hypothetical protein
VAAGAVADGGFDEVRVEPRVFEARFPADGFVENVESAYSAVIPEFSEDPSAFRAFVETVDRGLKELPARHRDGIAFPLHLNVAAGTAS